MRCVRSSRRIFNQKQHAPVAVVWMKDFFYHRTDTPDTLLYTVLNRTNMLPSQYPLFVARKINNKTRWKGKYGDWKMDNYGNSFLPRLTTQYEHWYICPSTSPSKTTESKSAKTRIFTAAPPPSIGEKIVSRAYLFICWSVRTAKLPNCKADLRLSQFGRGPSVHSLFFLLS